MWLTNSLLTETKTAGPFEACLRDVPFESSPFFSGAIVLKWPGRPS